jgi:hypothetical protein
LAWLKFVERHDPLRKKEAPMDDEQVRLNYDLARKVDGLTVKNAVEAMATDNVTLDMLIDVFGRTKPSPLEGDGNYLKELSDYRASLKKNSPS